MSVLKSGVFTYQLTDETLVITESMGVRMVSIFNGTAVNELVEQACIKSLVPEVGQYHGATSLMKSCSVSEPLMNEK